MAVDAALANYHPAAATLRANAPRPWPQSAKNDYWDGPDQADVQKVADDAAPAWPSWNAPSRRPLIVRPHTKAKLLDEADRIQDKTRHKMNAVADRLHMADLKAARQHASSAVDTLRKAFAARWPRSKRNAKQGLTCPSRAFATRKPLSRRTRPKSRKGTMQSARRLAPNATKAEAERRAAATEKVGQARQDIAEH